MRLKNRMHYAVFFTFCASCLVVSAVHHGGWAYLLCWPAVSFLLLALAYVAARPSLLGKQPDGRLAWWALLGFAPVLLLLWTIWHLQRWFSREPPCQEVAPGLWLGRRPFAHEVPADVRWIVDLTAEFPASRGLLAGRDYLLVATLDGLAPEEAAFRAAVNHVAALASPVLVHCAMGHGRSATVVAAVLLARGIARDVREAEEQLRRVRPRVRLNAGQRRLLRRVQGEGPCGSANGC